MNFFENLTLLRSENPELKKVAYIAQDYAQKISGHFDFSGIYGELNGGQQKSVSCAEIQIYSINFPLETLLGSTKTKKKRYRGVATEVDNTQTQRKQKKLKENGVKTEK